MIHKLLIFLSLILLVRYVHTQSVSSCSGTLSIGVDFSHDGVLTITPQLNGGVTSVSTCQISLTSAYGTALNPPIISGVTSCAAISTFDSNHYGGTFALGTEFAVKYTALDSDSNHLCESTTTFTASACKDASNSLSSLETEWRAEGSLVVSLANEPSGATDSRCKMTLSKYSGVSLVSPVIKSACSTTFSKPSGSTFIPGESNQFSFKLIDTSTPSNTVCVIPPSTVSFTKCSGSPSVGLLKYPFSRIQITPTGFVSSSNKCVLRTFDWGGSAGSYSTVSCDSSTRVAASDYGTFSGLVAEFGSSVSDYENTQPLCITDISSLTVNQCNSGTAPVSLSYRPYSTIRAKYSYDMSPKKCALFVKKWNTFTASATSADVMYFEDSSCALNGYKDISVANLVTQFSTNPGFSFTGTYEVEFAAYDTLSTAGGSLTNNPACASSAVSLTLNLPSCSAKLSLVVDFTSTGDFTLTPTVIDSSASIANCQFQLTKANGFTLLNAVTFASAACGSPRSVVSADYGGSFTENTDFEFVYTGSDTNGNVVCQSTRVVNTSRCKSSTNAVTSLYGWSKSADTLYVGETNQPVAAGSASCVIEVLKYGGVSTYVEAACDSSLITSLSKPSGVTVQDSTFSYHLQLLDASLNILCSSKLHSLSNTACTDGSSQAITTSGTEYQGDGTIQVTLSNVSPGVCSVVAVNYRTGYVAKSCGSGTVPFYSSDFTPSFSLGNSYEFLLMNTVAGDTSTQTCATPVTVSTASCSGGADLGITFDSSGNFTIYPRNVNTGTVKSCSILMTGYDSDTNLRVKASSTSCTDAVTFSKSDSVSKSFGYGGTFSFSILGYNVDGAQICASANNQITECSVSPNRAAVSPQYTGDGDFYVSSVNFPGMSVNQACQYEIVTLAGSNLLGAGNTVIRVDCDNSIKGLFLKGITTGLSGSFTYGASYMFRRRVTVSGNPVCYSASTTVYPTLCKDGDSTASSLRYWHDTVNYYSVVSNPPSVVASDNCQISLIQGSVRKATTGACSSFLGSTASISATGLSSATATALKFSLQVFDTDGLQKCSVGGSSLLACTNDATGASFGIGSDFAGKFYVGISKSHIGVAVGNTCRVEMIRINSNVVSSAFVQKAVTDCSGTTIVPSDYNPAISSASLVGDSLFDFRVVRLDSSNNPICYSPIRTFTYTQCPSTIALGWVNSGNLVVTYKDLPNVSSGVYAGKTCSIQSLQLSDNYGYSTASCSAAASFTSTDYTPDKTFLYHIQVSSSSPSVIQCATPTYTLIDSACSGVSVGTAYDDTGIFTLTFLGTSESANQPCEFAYIRNSNSGNIAPFQAVQDCLSASFTDNTNFQFGRTFAFKYRRVSGSTESCSVPASITPAKCVSATSGSTYSSLSATHTSAGVFTITLANPPAYDATGRCVYKSSAWADATPDCTLNKATVNVGGSYSVGSTYNFRFAFFPAGSSIQTCTTPSISYVDCSSTASVYGWYSGDGDFSLSVFNAPTLSGGDKCRYEFLKYNGNVFDVTAALPYVDSSDCSSAKFIRNSPGGSPFSLGTFSFGTDYTYRLRVVNTLGTTTRCYSAITSGTTAQCSPAVSVSLVNFDLVRTFTMTVVGGPDPAVNTCQVSLLNYGSSNVGYLSGGTGACGGATFTYTNAGRDSAPAIGGYYRFGYLNYDSATGSQVCASATFATTDCNSSGDIAVQYYGNGDVVVESKNAPTGGSCTIQMLKYANTPKSLSSTSCGSSSFTQQTVGVAFTFGTAYVFKQNVVPTSGSCVSPEITITANQCSQTSQITTLSVEWRADGRILAQVVNSPTSISDRARISLYSYSGAVLASMIIQTGTSQVTFNIPAGSTFVAGSDSVLLFTATDGATPVSTVCASSPTTVTFTQCSGGGSVSLLKYPFSRILVTPSNIPRGNSNNDQCVLRTFSWGAGSNIYTAVDCSSPTLLTVSGYGTFSAVIATYNVGVTDYSNTQPNCVTPLASITVPQCNSGSSPISVYTNPFDIVRVTYAYDMSPMDCALFVKRWNTYTASTSSTSVVAFEDPSCALSASYTISHSAFVAKLGSNPTFSLSGPYEIEFAAYTASVTAGYALTVNPTCASDSVSITVPSCSNVIELVIDFNDTGVFTITPITLPSVYTITSCKFALVTVNNVPKDPITEYPVQACNTPTTVDLRVGFSLGHVFEFRFVALDASGNDVCASKRSITASRCTSSSSVVTSLYGWSASSSSVNVGLTSRPYSATTNNCYIEVLKYGGISTYVKVACSGSSLVNQVSKPASVTATNQAYSYHVQLHDSSSNILCSSQIHSLDNSPCTTSDPSVITSTSTEYQGDGTFQIALSGITSNACTIVAVKYSTSLTNTFIWKTCATNVPFYLSDLSLTGISFALPYQFLLRDTLNSEVSTQTCATLITVTPAQCGGGADLGISFNSTGVFTVTPRNVPGSIKSCKIVMTKYDQDVNLRVKPVSISCSDPVTFQKSDSTSNVFGYGGTFSFLILGYDSSGAQVCTSVSNSITECSVSPNRASVTPQYTGRGDFAVSSTNFPAMSASQSCEYEITTLKGSSLLATGESVIRVACDNSIRGYFYNGVTTGYSYTPFSYNQVYEFRRRVIQSSSPICYSAITAITSTQCQDSTNANTVVQYWHDTVSYFAWVPNPPSNIASKNCIMTFIQGSTREEKSDTCATLLGSVVSIEASKFSDATVNPLRISLQIINTDGGQVCSTDTYNLLSCSNGGSGQSFGIGTDFEGSFFIGISKTGIGFQTGNTCRVEILRINGNLVSGSFIQKTITNCDGATITTGDYTPAVSGAGSIIDFRVVRLSGSDVVCYSPIRTFTYTQCPSTRALGWVDSGNLVVTYKDLPNVSTGTYAGKTCGIETVQLSDNYSYKTASCSSAARFTNSAYVADKLFRYHIQITSASPSVVSCSTPTYTLTDTTCSGLSGGVAYDDTGIFKVSLSASDSTGPSCEFVYLNQETVGDIAPLQALTDCQTATFTDTTNFQYGKYFRFRYRRFNNLVETCSIPITVTPQQCVSAAPTTSTLSASHTSTGVFTVALWNHPVYADGGTCKFYSSEVEAGGTPACSLNSATIDLTSGYAAGGTYKFRFAYFPPSSAIQSCTSSTLTYVDCATPTRVYGWYSGDGDFSLADSDPPSLSSGYKCRFEFLKYNSNLLDVTAGLPYVDSSDCSGAKFLRVPGVSFNLGAFSIGSDYAYRLRVVDGAGTATQCHSAVTSGTAVTCTGVTVGLTRFNLDRQFTVAITGGPSPATTDCQIALIDYNTAAVGFVSSGIGVCATGSFTYLNAGLTAAPSNGGYYRFGFMKYDASTGAQTCASPTLAVTDCSSTGDIAVQYNGIGNFVVQSKNPPSGAGVTCAIELTSYAGSTVSLTSASCTASSFTQAAAAVPFTFSSNYVFKQRVTPQSGSCVSPEVSITSITCEKDSVTTSLSIAWRADGRLIVQVNDAPTVTASNAQISLYSYSGTVLSSLSTQTGFGPVTFTIPSGSTFVPGAVSKVLFSEIDGATPASTLCAIAPTEVTFTECSGGSIQIIKYPFSRILVKPTDLSGSGQCVLRSHGWGSNSDTYTVVDCTNPTVVSAIGYGQFTAVIAKFSSGVTDYANTEPLCVTPKASVTVTECNSGTAPIAISNPAFNKLRVTYEYDMTSNVCGLFVRKWYGFATDVASLSVVYFEDTSCANTATYDILTSQVASQLGSSPGFDLLSTYEIEYAAYSSLANAGDSLALSPSCSSTPVTFTPPVTACANSVVSFTRIDGQSVRVNVNCVAPYGYTSMSISGYSVASGKSVGTLAASLAKPVQSCGSGLIFDFTYAVSNDYPYYTGDVVQFKFNYYGSSELTSFGCSATLEHTIPAFPATSLPTLQISTNSGSPPYTFTVSKTVPFNGGTCTLTFDCGSGLTGLLAFATCNTALVNKHFYEIVQGRDVPFNTQCTFTYTYVTTQPTVSSDLSPTASVNQQITPPSCLTTDSSLITLSLRFTKLETIVTTISGFPDTSGLASPVCQLALSKWSGETVSPPVVVDCETALGYVYTFTKPAGKSDFKYSRQSISSLFGYIVQLREKDDSGFRCISSPVTYYANVCEVSSSTLTGLTLVKRPYGTVYALIASVPSSVQSCQIYFYKWKGTSTYTSTVISPCASTSFDAGSLAFDYTTTGFSATVVGYTSTTPDVSIDTPYCATKTVSELVPTKCAVSLTTTVVDYDLVNVKSNTAVADGSICSFYAYKWNGADVHSLLVHKETAACTTGVNFSSSDVSSTFAYDTDYLFGYAVFSSAAADVLNSNPSCSYEPTQAADGLTAAKPTCPSVLQFDWIDIKKVTISLPSAPASYGRCLLLVGDGTSNSGLQTCSTSYTYTTDQSTIDGQTLSISYKFYGKSTSVNLVDDVVCASSAQSVTVNQYSCSDSLTKTIAADFTNYNFAIPGFPESLGSCRLVVTCTGFDGEEKYVSFTSCTTALNLEYYQISDLFSGALGHSATCSFAFDYFAASSDPNTPLCRSSVISNVAIQPPDCIGGSTHVSTGITTKYTGLGKVYVNIDDAPATLTGFKCRIRMLKWADSAVTSTTHSVADCPTTATEFSSYPSRFVFGSNYDFVVEQYKESTGSLHCRSTTKKTFTTTACSSESGTSAISLHQLPFSRVEASITNPPSSDAKCAFYITSWNVAVVTTRSTSLVSCTSASILNSPNGQAITSGSIGAYMVQFSSTSSSVDDQPICGTDIGTRSTYQCSETPTTSVTNYGEITLAFSPSVSSRKCVFYVDEWAGDSTSGFLRTYSKLVADCSSGAITSTAIGYASTTFAYDSVYKFEFAQFLTTATIGTDEPSCTGFTAPEAATKPVCSGLLALTRIDGETVSITLSNHPGNIYGLCQVIITEITAPGGTSATSVNIASATKSCAAGTVFTFASTDIDLADSASIRYVYKFFGNSADVVNPTCTSSPTGPTTLTHYDIGSLVITQSVGPLYAFSLQNAPTDGSCKVTITCAGGASGYLEFACPTGSSNFDFPTINTAVGYVKSGETCSATVSYFTAKHPSPATAYSTTSAQTFTLTASACTSTGLTVAYSYEGTFHLALNNPPSTDTNRGCRVTVLKWAGSALTKKYLDGCPSTLDITDIAMSGAAAEPLFRYGSAYEFVVQQYSKANADIFYCQSSPTTSSQPALCSSVVASVSASIIKYPFEQIRVFASNVPTGYTKCVFFITQWAGTYGVTRTTSMVDCAAGETISAADTGVTFAYAYQYSVRVSVYPDASTDTTSQPYCGINPVSVIPALCQYTLTMTNPAYITIRTVIGSPGYPGGSCNFFVSQWGTTDLTTGDWASMTRLTSTNCGGVNFVGSSISTGLGLTFEIPYTFEYAEYDNPAPTDYSITNPTCSRSGSSYSPPTLVCVPGSSLSVTRNDGQTVFVTIVSPHQYGLCVVELIEYNGNTVSISSAPLPCDSKFYFTYTTGGPTYAPNDTVKFKYTWYIDGANIFCSSTQPAAIQLGALNCGPLTLIYDAPSYVYTFSFNMKPRGGKCMIYFTCDSGSKTGSLRVSDCSQTEVTTLNQLNAYLDDPLTMILGVQSVCSFWYDYSTTTPNVLTCSSTPTDPGVTIQMGSRPCKPSATSRLITTANPVYFADGTWSVSLSNPPAAGRFSDALCRILITRWSGQVVRETYVNCQNLGSSATALSAPASVTGRPLVFGEEYSFLVQYVKSTDNIFRYCDCQTRTIVPEVCRVDSSPSSAQVNLNLMPYPFNSIGASLSGLSYRSGKCNYYLEKWAGSDSTVTSGPIDCSLPIALVDQSKPFLRTGVYTATMIQFPGIDTSASPVCGLNTQSVTPTKCSSEFTLTMSASASSSVRVGFPANAKPDASKDCYFFVNKWNGVSTADPTRIFWKKSTACADVIFSPSDVGGTPASYGSEYAFEFALTNSPSSNLGLSVISCTSDPTEDLIVDPRCSPSNLVFNRIDSNSIRVKLLNPLQFNCEITILQDGADATASSLTGACNSNFDFHHSTKYITGNAVTAQFRIINGVTTICESNPKPVSFPRLSTYTVPSYSSCPGLSVTTIGTTAYPLYRYSISAPTQYHGTCELQAECGGTFYDLKQWTSCDTHITADYIDINRAVLGGVAPDQSCRFRYIYTSVSEDETCTSPSVTFGPISIPTCTASGTPSSLNIGYSGYGIFSITVTNPPTVVSTSVCRVTMTRWNGAAVNVISDKTSCTETFTMNPPAGSGGFTFGTSYSFQLSVVDSLNSVDTVTCRSSVKSVVPPICTNQLAAVSRVALAAIPNDRLRASLTNNPVGASCEYYVTQWNNAPVTSYKSDLVDCGKSAILSPALTFGYLGDYSVRAVVYSGGASTPICGTTILTRKFTACSGSIDISAARVGAVRVTISNEPKSGTRCVVYLKTWNGQDASSLNYSLVSDDCSSVVFDAVNVDKTFAFGSTYEFSYARFGILQNIKIDDPDCSATVVSTPLAGVSCSTSNIQVTRPDPFSIIVSLHTVPAYGVCQFTVKSSPTSTSSLAQSGPCSAQYTFTTTSGIVELANSALVSVRYSFYADGVATNTPSCSAVNDATEIPNFENCPTLSISTPVVGSYVATLSSPAPAIGICQLILTGFSSSPIAWSPCNVPLSLTYADLLAKLGATQSGLPLGSTLSFKYSYYSSGSTNVAADCHEVAAGNTVVAVVPVTVSQTPLSTSSILLSIPTLPASLSALPTCTWIFNGCNGDTSHGFTRSGVTCASSQTFTDSQIQAGAVCSLRVTVSLDGTSVAGDSGPLNFFPIGPPAWGANQLIPTVSGGSSSSCLTVSWETPNDTGGSPIQCYTVDQAVGLSGAYDIKIVTCAGQTPQTLVPLSASICNLSTGVIYKVRVTAIAGYGSASIEATDVRLEYLLCTADAEYTTLASWPAIPITSSTSFPSVIVQSKIGTNSDSSTSRIFLSQLLPRSTVTDQEETLIRPASSSIENRSPIFSNVLTSSGSGLYTLGLSGVTFAAGDWSLITFSLEGGGLRGTYWLNTDDQSGQADTQRKDPQVKFDRFSDTMMLVGAFKGFFVRWTGFIEPEYTEAYTFTIYSGAQTRLFVDGNFLVNTFSGQRRCLSGCSASVQLTGSDRSSLSTRKFASIRLDMRTASSEDAWITLSWSSPRTPNEAIPSDRLFKSVLINNSIQNIVITSGELSVPNCVVEFPGEYTSGEFFDVIVTAKDAAGNVRSGLGSPDSFSASVLDSNNTVIGPFSSNPLSGNNDGKYKIPIKIDGVNAFTIKVYKAGSTNQLGTDQSITLKTGVPSKLPTADVTIAAGSPTTAGSDILVQFKVADSSGNPLPLEKVRYSDISLNATWSPVSDPTSGLVNSGSEELTLRQNRYGSIFSPTQLSYAGSNTFVASFKLLNRGSYSLNLRYGPVPAQVTTANIGPIGPDPNPAGSNSVVVACDNLDITTLASNPSLQSGTQYKFSIQLRDKYLNAITSTQTATVAIKLQKTASGNCVPSTTAGVYQCIITPANAGTDLRLSISVNNFQASVVSTSVVAGSKVLVPGPWLVSVTAGALYSAFATGIQSIYQKNRAVVTPIIFRDPENNVLSSIANGVTISGTFSKSGNPDVLMPQSLVTNNGDGTFSFNMICPDVLIGYSLSLSLTVGGTTLAIDTSGSPGLVNCRIGSASLTDSTCSYPGSATAGSSASFGCSVKDNALNLVAYESTFVATHFGTTGGTDDYVITHPKTADGVFTSTGTFPSATGSYNVYSVIGIRGGLFGSYYSDIAHTTLIGTSLSESQPPNNFDYTRIDSAIRMEAVGLAQLSGQDIASVRWTGILTIPGADTYNFKIIYKGAFNMILTSIGGTIVRNISDSNPDPESDDTLTYSFSETFGGSQNLFIKLEYIPKGDTKFLVTWNYATSSTPSLYSAIAPRFFQAPMRIPSTGSTITIT